MTTAPNTALVEYARKVRTELGGAYLKNYKYAGQEPQLYLNLTDDVTAVIEACRDLGYDWYPYPGGVIQMQPTIFSHKPVRFFTSFNTRNDGYQQFHEASGEGMVFGPGDLQDFLDALKHGLLPQADRKP